MLASPDRAFPGSHRQSTGCTGVFPESELVRESAIRCSGHAKNRLEHALQNLRSTVVGRVEHPADYAVVKSVVVASCVYVLKSSKMILPHVSALRDNLAVLKSQLNIGQVVPEGISGEPLDVLQEEC